MAAEDSSADLRHLHADSATVRPGGRTARVGQAVMQSTLEELSRVGYQALRIESVAQAAGVNKTTVYRRWGDKSRLVATALIEAQGNAVPIPDTGDLRTDLVTLLKEIRTAIREPWVAAVIGELGSRRSDGSGIHEVLDQLWPERFKLSRQVVERAIERGELPEAVDPDFIIEMCCGPLYFRWLLENKQVSDAFIESSVDAILNGVRAVPR